MLLKKVLLGTVASVIVLSSFSSVAKAQDPCGNSPYMAIRSGFAMIKDHIHKNTWDVGVAAGMQLNQFRTELEYTYRGRIKGDYAMVNHKIDTMTLLVNGYYDIQTGSALHPYINLGIGTSRLEIKSADSKTDYKFSWGGGVGMSYDLTQSVSFDLGYRFLDLGKQIKSNEFYGGLRFAF